METQVFALLGENQESDKLKYLIIGAVIGLVSSLLLFLLDKVFERVNRKRQLKSEIFGLCDKLLRNAVALEMYAISFGGFNKSNQIKNNTIGTALSIEYFIKTNELGLKYNDLKSDLIISVSKLNDFFYVKNKKRIEELVVEFHPILVRQFIGIFNNAKTVEEVDAIIANETSKVEEYITKVSVGKILQEIQKIVKPEFFLKGYSN
jgi:hypothetical protein